MEKYVILGASIAAISAVEAIRKVDREGGISLISKEDHMPYSPMILPYVISEIIGEKGLALRDNDFFENMKVKLALGKKAVGLDPAKKTVILENGGTAQFEKLLIAIGAQPAIPRIPGADLEEVCSLRTLEDGLKIRKLSKVKKSAVVVGAGLIAMHVAEILSGKGLHVKVIEMLPQVLAQNFDGASASMIQKVFEKKGVEFFTGAAAKEIRKAGEQLIVRAEDGREIDGEFVVMAAGVKPHIELVEGTGILCGKGILVDERMHTSVNDIYAAGDVAEAKSFLSGERMVNPIQPCAQEQGAVAGFNMAGQAVVYGGTISMNAFKFFGNSAFTVGNIEGKQSVAYADADNIRYRKLVFEGDRIIGTIFVNDPVEPGIVLDTIKRKTNIGNLKEEIVSAGATTESWYKCLCQEWVAAGN